MEKRKLTLYGWENQLWLAEIYEELRQIAGIEEIELRFETGELIFKANPASIPRIENAVVTIIHILDCRIGIIGQDGKEV